MARVRLSLIQALEPIDCSCSYTVYDTNTKQECFDFGYDFVNGLVNGLTHVYIKDQFCNDVKSKLTNCGIYNSESEYLNESGCSIVCKATCGVAADMWSDFIVKVKSLGGFPNWCTLDDAARQRNRDEESESQPPGLVWKPL